jgi:preprotein translocase subunit YajC
MWSSVAWAQAAARTPSVFEQLMPFLFIFVIFYFLIIRPQSKRHRQHQDFLSNIKRGDEVLTSSGIFGTIEGITDKFITLEVSDGVRMRILKSSIAASAKEDQK